MNRPFALAIAVFAAATLPSRAADQPNFVFIIADDLTFRDIGCYGGQAHTPNIDRLATEGMRFTRCFQATAMCSPTRHNIYTGLYPVKSGAYPNHTFAKPGTKSIAHYLQAAGYRVALTGKRHVAPPEVFPFEYLNAAKGLNIEAIDTLCAEQTAARKPFCLFACSVQPHTPWNKGDPTRYPADSVKLPPYFADTPETREAFSRYLAETTYFDGEVGQVLDTLAANNLENDTLVMVVSEQGSAFPFAKWTCYGNGLQAAMIVRWPGTVQAGSTTDAMVEYVDICPTFVDAAGATPSEVLDGESFLPVLRGQSDRHKDYVFGVQTTRGISRGSEAYAVRSIRSERYRLILNLNYESPFKNNVTASAKDFKFFSSWTEAGERGDARAAELAHRYQHRPAVEFYDVGSDPLEMTNIAEDPRYSAAIADHRKRLEAWMAQQGDKGVATEMEALQRKRRASKK